MSEYIKLVNMENMPEGAKEWLAYAARGYSGETIFSVLTGCHILPVTDYDTPYSGSDFTRCRILLKMVPSLKSKMGEMRLVSPEWNILVAHWDELEILIDSENNWFRGDRSGTAEKTRKRIYELKMQVATNGYKAEDNIFQRGGISYDCRGHVIKSSCN